MPFQKLCVNVNFIIFAPRGGRAHIVLKLIGSVYHIGQIICSLLYIVRICIWDVQGLSLYAESISVT